MADTGEIIRPGRDGGFSSTVMKVVITLAIAAIIGGIGAWADGRVTASDLAEHKRAEETRLAELKADIKALRDELRGDLQDIRQAIDRKR